MMQFHSNFSRSCQLITGILQSLMILSLMSCIAMCAHGQAADSSAQAEVESDSSSGPWVSQTIEGWRVHVRVRLMVEDKAAVERALALLGSQLKVIERSVPAAAVVELRKVPLWFSPEYERIIPKAEYHPNVAWLKSNGRDSAMEKGVEFTNVRIFEAETKRMPNFALHELAHAYHDRVLGFHHREVIAAYQAAKSSGKYDRVLRRDALGKQQYDRAYALTDHKEYFAEATEAFFVRNDFYPFDRNELITTDPGMVRVLERLWGVQTIDSK